ncbi:hypothetical protein [Vibrio barjaei]|uniref:hypothetical protein n=1 Tax=Vibrio barjaei TaxID=1676683 RepID=UPI0022835379|nr:hypothetical protein [Vibrio barjaei]MCY9872341.1 hypothetical protein [Vibrio barjaei]
MFRVLKNDTLGQVVADSLSVEELSYMIAYTNQSITVLDVSGDKPTQSQREAAKKLGIEVLQADNCRTLAYRIELRNRFVKRFSYDLLCLLTDIDGLDFKVILNKPDHLAFKVIVRKLGLVSKFRLIYSIGIKPAKDDLKTKGVSLYSFQVPSQLDEVLINETLNKVYLEIKDSGSYRSCKENSVIRDKCQSVLSRNGIDEKAQPKDDRLGLSSINKCPRLEELLMS